MMADTARMLSPRPSATRTAARAGGGAVQGELSQSYPRPHQHQEHQEPCLGGLLDPFFLTEIDENVQAFSGTAATSGSRTSLSGDGASTSAKDAALYSPCMECVPSAREKTVRKSRSACELRLECLLHTSMGSDITKDEAGDSKRKQRQPSSFPSSSRRDPAGCFSSVEVMVPTVVVAAADEAIATTPVTATDPEAGPKSSSLLSTWVTAQASTVRRAGAPSTDSGVTSRTVNACLASPQSLSLSHSKPSSDNRDGLEGSYVLDSETTLLPSKSVDAAVSTDSSTVSSYASEAQERATEEATNCATTGGTTVGSKMTLLVSLIMRCAPSRTGPPHSATSTEDGAADAGRLPPLELYPPVALPSLIEEVPCGVEYDVPIAHHDDTCDMKDITVAVKEDADQRRSALTEEPTLQASTANRRTQHTQWSMHPLPVTAWLLGSSAMDASPSTALWRSALWSRPAMLTLCSCVSARSEEHSVQVLPRLLASGSAVSKNCAIHQRRPSSFTNPVLYMLPPPSFLTCTPAPGPTKVLAMRSWADLERASLSFPGTWLASVSAHLSAVPPSLTTGSTTLRVPSMLCLTLPPLPDDTSVSPASVAYITRAPSRLAPAAEEVAARQSCDVWRLARCYAHFERAVEQRGDDGVWLARGISSLPTRDSVKLVAAAGVARWGTESSLDDDGEDSDAWLFPSGTLDVPPDAPSPTSPQLTSPFPFSSVASVLRAEKEEEVFASAVMWAVGMMTGVC
ncbi:hypothetical protein, unknown function [Leishmania mexicana MHOM/GT/2001/U1103]|uniref:Uncharacterized protein n=1 Tax=Leishmania mexicana (strain MHOM/GT/2001/U1103) TaxID=929439 RepID=E9ANX5_LEIMU|nr:hypothetical protein, unknown function [Leishmania mexicana MHOM/GT/2001/U1103]CBZ24639.1 hypothetical protein, unknown function [Leishmania mexicana MHOM/GT/2001/U1103]